MTCPSTVTEDGGDDGSSRRRDTVTGGRDAKEKLNTGDPCNLEWKVSVHS